jgi:flagellar protein FlaJ
MNKIEWLGLGFGLFMVVGSVFLFWGDIELMSFVIVISVILALIPIISNYVLLSSKVKKKEEKFLEFLRDLTENVKSGTPISRAVVNLGTRDYDVLSPNILKLVNQINLGLPFYTALDNFAKDVKSPVVSRAITLIREAERAGGKTGDILESVLGAVLRKEQKSGVYNLVVQGYIIFIIFVLISLVLQFYFIPKLQDVGFDDLTDFSSDKGEEVNTFDVNEIALPLFVMMLVQAIFTGLVIGKVSEGSLLFGIRHSFILVAMVLLVYFGAKVFI